MRQSCNGCDTVDYAGDLNDAGVCLECSFADDTVELDAEQTAAIIAIGATMLNDLFRDLGGAAALICESCGVISFAERASAWKAEVFVELDLVEIQVLSRADGWIVGDEKTMVAVCPSCKNDRPTIARVTLPAVAAL